MTENEYKYTSYQLFVKLKLKEMVEYMDFFLSRTMNCCSANHTHSCMLAWNRQCLLWLDSAVLPIRVRHVAKPRGRRWIGKTNRDVPVLFCILRVSRVWVWKRFIKSQSKSVQSSVSKFGQSKCHLTPTMIVACENISTNDGTMRKLPPRLS